MTATTILHPLEWTKSVCGREMFIKYKVDANGDVRRDGIVDGDGNLLAFFTPPTGNKEQGILRFLTEEKSIQQ